MMSQKNNQTVNPTSQTILEVTSFSNLRPLFRLCQAGVVISSLLVVVILVGLILNYLLPFRVNQREKELLLAKNNESAVTRDTGGEAGFVLDGDDSGGFEQNAGSATTTSTSRQILIPFLTLPTEATEYLQLKERLLLAPDNRELVQELRAVDLLLRNDYFERRQRAKTGALLLLLSAGAMVLFASTARSINRKLPIPSASDSQGTEKSATGQPDRFPALLTIAGVLFGITVGLFLTSRGELGRFLAEKAAQPATGSSVTLPENASTPGDGAIGSPTSRSSADNLAVTIIDEPAPDPSDRETFLKAWNENWPVFRGPHYAGILSFQSEDETGENAPLHSVPYPSSWDFESGKSVVWTAPVSLPGHNSPIIWGERIFLLGADETNRVVACYHTKTGKLLWETAIPVTPEGAGEIHPNHDTGYAAPTAVTDGSYVYAIFPNGDLTALDYQGNIVWSKGFGIPENTYGYSASLALFFDLVIVQIDVDDAEEGSEQGSRLVAVSGKDGEQKWRTLRNKAIGSWSSPAVLPVGDSWQIVAMGDPYLAGYDPETGKELWRYTAFSTDVSPSPIAQRDIVYGVNAQPHLAAINPQGEGELTKTPFTLWTVRGSGLPNACSPLPLADMIILLAENGNLTGVSLETKKKAWELFVDESDTFYSTPLYDGNYIYLFGKSSDEPHAYVIDPKCLEPDSIDPDALDLSEIAGAIVSKIALTEPVHATPAMHQGRLFIRGEHSLWCVGESDE